MNELAALPNGVGVLLLQDVSTFVEVMGKS